MCNDCGFMSEHMYVIRRHVQRHSVAGCECHICGRRYKVNARQFWIFSILHKIVIFHYGAGGTAVAAPPPFRPSDPALCGSCPLVTPYYCRLGDLLCLFCVYPFVSTLLSVYMCIYLFSFTFVASPSVLWYCWLGLLTCKNRLPYNLYCVGGDVKHCSIQSNHYGTCLPWWRTLTSTASIQLPCVLVVQRLGRRTFNQAIVGSVPGRGIIRAPRSTQPSILQG